MFRCTSSRSSFHSNSPRSISPRICVMPCKERKRVAIFLVNGVRLVGHIESFDQYLVMLSSAAGIQAVYKHSISTIQEDTGKAFTAGSARTGAGAPRDADSKRPVAISHKRRLPTNMGNE